MVQTDVDVAVIILLQEVGDQPMSDLRVEHKVADQVVLANECRSILTEIVEDLHDLVGLHHLFEAVAERINGLEVYDEAFVGIVDLNQLHAPVLRQALAVHAQDRGALRLDHVHDGLGELTDLPGGRDHVHAGGEWLSRPNELLWLQSGAGRLLQRLLLGLLSFYVIHFWALYLLFFCLFSGFFRLFRLFLVLLRWLLRFLLI